MFQVENYIIMHICIYIVVAFFKKRNVAALTVKALFDFITDPTVNEDNMDEYLDKAYEKMMEEADEENNPQRQVEEGVFKQAYIPQRIDQVSIVILLQIHIMHKSVFYVQTLCVYIYKLIKFSLNLCKFLQVIDIERDINRAKSGEDLIYKTVIGLEADLCKPLEIPEILSNKSQKEDEDLDEESDDSENSKNSTDGDDSDNEHDNREESKDMTLDKAINGIRPRNESPASRKVRVYILL